MRTCLAALASSVVLACSTPPAPVAAPAPTTPKKELACVDLQSCEAACLAGEGASCSKAAKAMHAAPLEADAPRLATVLERACDGGHAPSCVELAMLHLNAPALPRDEAKAKAAVEKGCELGSPIACLTFAREEIVDAPLMPEERGPTSSPTVAKAMKLAREACAAGDGKSCALVAMTLDVFPSAGDDRVALATRAASLLQQSCLGGEVEDCMSAALQLAGPRGDGQPQKVEHMLRRGCDLGDLRACVQLAQAVAPSSKEAIYRKACSAGGDEACIVLGKAEADGVVPATDDTRGLSLMKRGAALARARCDLAEEESCRVLAKALPLGVLASADAGAAVDYLVGVCARRSPVLCNDLADAVAASLPPLRDAAKVEALKRLACEYGYPFACPDPIAKLGIYMPLEVEIVDRGSGLAWSESPAKATLASAAETACPKGTKLPTPKQLSTLVDASGAARAFAKATTPKGARLWSTGMDADGARLALDLATGKLAPAGSAPALARCVRLVGKTARPKGAVLSLQMSGGDLHDQLRDGKGKLLHERSVKGAAEERSLVALTEVDRAAGPLHVAVDPSVDWALAARFVREAKALGAVVAGVWIAP